MCYPTGHLQPSCYTAVYCNFFLLSFSQCSVRTQLSPAKLTWSNFSIKISWDGVKCFAKFQISVNSYTDFFLFAFSVLFFSPLPLLKAHFFKCFTQRHQQLFHVWSPSKLSLPTGRLESPICPRTIWLGVCKPWRRHLSPWLSAEWLV